jgi:hypothetical protein
MRSIELLTTMHDLRGREGDAAVAPAIRKG